MAELVYATPYGKLKIQGWREPVMNAAADLGQDLARDGREVHEFREFAGERVYLKGAPLRGKSRWRHGLKWLFLGRPVPRIREYHNLCWLTERHFQTAIPLAAGAFFERGLPAFQFLITVAQEDVRTFDEFCREEPASARAPVLAELARELARMHALGFLHHDLFARNLLVAPETAERRITFLDTWAGGPPHQWRSAAYDLACFFLDAADGLEREEQDAFLEAYVRYRAAQDRPVEGSAFLPRIVSARRALVAQLEKEPGRLRGRAMPGAWEPPEPTSLRG